MGHDQQLRLTRQEVVLLLAVAVEGVGAEQRALDGLADEGAASSLLRTRPTLAYR